MSEEKQIEEMAKVLCPMSLTEYCASGNCTNPNCLVNAKALEVLYDAGYRKQEEGEWEIVKGSNGKEKMVCTNCRHQQDLASTFTYCPNCGARMGGGAE